MVKGLANSVSYKKNGEYTDDLSDADAENIIRLNGFKSELLICRGGEK